MEFLGQFWPPIAAVGPNQFQEREKFAHLLEDRHSAVSILGRGLVNDRLKQKTLGIDDDMTFAAFDFLATVIPGNTATPELDEGPWF